MNLNQINRIFFGGVIGLLAGFSFYMAVLPFVAENSCRRCSMCSMQP